MKKLFKACAIFAGVLLLTACSSGLDGTYTDATGIMQYKFESDGKVYISAMGQETLVDYEMDDNKVIVSSPKGNQVFTLNEDGSLQSGTGLFSIKLTKKPE